MFAKEDPSWQGVTDPSTGMPFTSYEGYSSWASGMEKQGTAGATAGNTAAPSQWAWSGDAPDWSKTGWNVTSDTSHFNNPAFYVAPENMYGFQIGQNVGYLNPTTGEIVYGTPGSTGQPGYDARLFGAGYDPNTTPGRGVSRDNFYGTKTGSGRWSVDYDYGLGKDALGIIPMQHGSDGTVTWFVAPAAGGGFVQVQSLQEAIASRDQYLAWLKTNPKGVQGATAPQPTTQEAAPTTEQTGTEQPGVLMTPGANEQFYDSTKDFYTQPTEAHKLWDQTANQPTKMEQSWNSFSGKFNQPSNAEDLYGAYRDIFSDPNYLSGYWDQAEKDARGVMEARAAAAGVGDSSMATRAGSNLSSVYDMNRLKSLEEFATTGMGLASSADTGFNNRASGSAALAALADKAGWDKLAAASGVDQTDLQRMIGGTNASSVAQSSEENRLTGGLTSATSLGNDMATLTSMGLNQAQAEKLMIDLQGIQMQLAQGNLTFSQAMTQASELASLPGGVSNQYMQYWLAQKLMQQPTAATSGNPTSPQIDIGTNVSMPATT